MTLRNTGYDASTSFGRKYIALAASLAADHIFMQDWNIEEIIKDEDVMHAVSMQAFGKWLEEELFEEVFTTLKQDVEPDLFDLMRRYFVKTFRETYNSKVKKEKLPVDEYGTRALPPELAGPTARVVKTTRTGDDNRVHELELTDPDYADGPVRFEVELGSDSRSEARIETKGDPE